MNSSIHTYISKCLKNLPSCSISYKVLWVNILLRSQLLTSATLKNNVLTKKNCWNNFTTCVRSSHLFIFDLYFGWRFRSQTLFFVGKEQEILIKLPFLPWNDDNNKYIQHQVFIITGKLNLRRSILQLLGITAFLLSLRIMKELA